MTELAHDSAETQRLLEQARSGAPGAVDRLLQRHRDYVRRFVEFRLDPQLRARVDPSDVVQEAQLEAVRRLDGYLGDAPMPFRLWLRQIAQDRLLMLRRHHRGARRRAVTREAAWPDESSLAFARQLLAFHDLRGRPGRAGAADALCRLVLLGMLPALVERDAEAFGEALYDFNARAGEMFAAVQGGIYGSPGVAEFVAFARRRGVRGVGQSSWGPAMFAVVEDAGRADHLAAQLRRQFGLDPTQVFVTRACDRGADLAV